MTFSRFVAPLFLCTLAGLPLATAQGQDSSAKGFRIVYVIPKTQVNAPWVTFFQTDHISHRLRVGLTISL